MTTTYNEARKEIYALFSTKWNSDSAAVAGYVPELRYKGVKSNNETPDPEKYFARASVISVTESQATLSDSVTGPGKRRYTSRGLVIIQIFGPKLYVDSQEKVSRLAEIAKSAFRGKTTASCIWFRNVRIEDLDPEQSFNRVNVIAEYQYDETN